MVCGLNPQILTYFSLGNVGLGRETISHLAQHNPSKIYLAARNASKAEIAIAELQALTPDCPPITFIHCDLSSFSSIQSCAREFVAKEERLDILILNAGIMAPPPALTSDGYEIQWGTNFMGHALLTKLLLPVLLRTASRAVNTLEVTSTERTTADATAVPEKSRKGDVRIITLSSIAHVGAWGLKLDQKKSPTGGNLINLWRYCESKLANAVYARELAKRYGQQGILSVSVHPGLVESDIWTDLLRSLGVLGRLIGGVRKQVFVDLEEGARGVLWAATAKRADKGGMDVDEAKTESIKIENGEYFTPVAVKGQGTRLLYNDNLGQKLWEWTEEELEKWTL